MRELSLIVLSVDMRLPDMPDELLVLVSVEAVCTGSELSIDAVLVCVPTQPVVAAATAMAASVSCSFMVCTPG